MKFAVTGANGFLGWHMRCALKARGDAFIAIDRPEWADASLLAEQLSEVDVVLHLAGANRAEPDELRTANLELARALTAALDRSGSRPVVAYANSIQAGNGSAFGDGKLAAAEHLSTWSARTGAVVVDVRVPNLFGEHGRPHYNSVVATFCHELATGGEPVVVQDREIPLLHVQDAVDRILDRCSSDKSGTVDLGGRPTSVRGVLTQLEGIRDLYSTGQIPATRDPFTLALFNTYRSFTFPAHFPIRPTVHSDQRGGLFECVRAHDGQSQVFCSTTRPGYTRGQHFHLRKVERFLVLAGQAEISLRRLFTDEVITFAVSGDEPAIVDMPTMWAHSITNTGPSDLMTLFWAHELLDPVAPDTFPEPVKVEPAHA